MDLKLTFFVGLFSLIAADQHQGVSFVPVGKELVYNYKTVIRSSVLEPAHFASEYMLHGELHVQGGQNSTFVRFSDLKYRVHNGETVPVDHFDWGEDFLPIPKEAFELTDPFIIQYDHDGKAMAIATKQSENSWSRNIKHGIASILQLDMTEIEKDVKHNHLFLTEEHTIYGECDVTYNVMPHENKIVVTKFQDPSTCRGGYKYEWMDLRSSGCVAPQENPMTSDSNRRYVLSKHDDVYCIDRVSATGTIYTYPFRAESEAYFVHVNQTMTLEKIFDIKEQIVIKEQKWIRGLHYISPEEDSTTGNFFDLSHGRKGKLNLNKLVHKIQKIISNIVDYTKYNHIDNKIPEIKGFHAINDLMFTLMELDLHSFEYLFNKLEEKKDFYNRQIMNIFIQLLPKVGTKASISFIKSIVHEEKIDIIEMVYLIKYFPFYVRHLNEKLLIELEDLLQLGNKPSSILRRAAILSFATLLQRTFEHNYDDEHVPKILERYVKLYYENMKAAESYELKMLWLEGLHNMKFPIIIRYLEPIIRGEEYVNEDFRFLSLWAALASAVRQPEYAYKLFWPILADRKLSTEIRIAAYIILMSCPPTMSRYLNMYWLMRHETNEALYHFHYTTLQSLKNTKHICYQEMGVYAKRLLRMSYRPVRKDWANVNYMFDYVDLKYGFGSLYQMLMLSSSERFTLFTEITTQIFNRPFSHFSMYLKIKKHNNDLENQIYTSNIKSTVGNVSQLIDDKKHAELFILKEGQVTMVHYLNEAQMRDLVNLTNLSFADWSIVFKNYGKDIVQVMYEFLGHIIIPSDFGTPVVLSMQLPVISTYEANITNEIIAGTNAILFHGNMHIKLNKHGSYFLDIYNPINNLWHGVKKISTHDLSLPVKFDFVFNRDQRETVNFSLKKWDDEHVPGVKIYMNTHTYIYGESNNEILHSFDKDAHVYEMVTKGKQYRTNLMLYDQEVDDIGSNVEIGVFDCERSISRGSIIRNIKLMHNKYGKNYLNIPFGRYLLTLENIYTYMMLTPNVGSCGFFARILPSVKKPIDRIDFVFIFYQEKYEETHILLHKEKIISRLTMSTKGIGGDLLRSWDFNFLLDMNKGHDDNKFKMTIARTVSGNDDFKINFEGEKKWSNENVFGKMKITFTEGEKNSFVEVNMKGEMSEDQKRIVTDKFYTYDECLDYPMDHFDEVVKHDLSCDIAETSLRKYTYDFKIHNSECPYMKKLLWYKNIWRANHVVYYKTVPTERPVEKDHFRIEFEYPVHRDEVDMHVTYPEYSVEYEGLPVNDVDWWNWFGLDNFHYSKYFMMKHKRGLCDTCIIDEKTVHRDLNDIIDHAVTDEWTVYAEHNVEPSKFILKVKKINGSLPLAIRIEENGHWLEIVPHGYKFTFLENDKVLSEVETSYRQDEWFSFKVLQKYHNVLIVTKNGMYLDFNGKIIRIDFPVGRPFTSLCHA